jgi:hypothetical protein
MWTSQKIRKLDPHCLFKISTMVRQYIGADMSFPPCCCAMLSLWVFTFWIGKTGWNLSRHRLFIALVKAEKEISFLHKSCLLKWQIAIERHSPMQTNTQPMPSFWPTSFFVTIYTFKLFILKTKSMLLFLRRLIRANHSFFIHIMTFRAINYLQNKNSIYPYWLLTVFFYCNI